MIPSDAYYSLLRYKLYFLSSLKCHFLSCFSLFFHFQLTIQIALVIVLFFSIFMSTIPIYTITQSMLFSLFSLIFTNHFVCCSLQAFIHSTYFPLSSSHVQLDTIIPRSFSLCLTTKDTPILDKGQSATKPPPLSLPKMAKTPINSLSSRSSMHQMVPTYLSSHFW